MALRNCLRVGYSRLHGAIKHGLQTRAMSASSSSNIVLDMDSNKGVATMKLNKKPVNSLSLEFLQEITNTIDVLEKDRGCRGLIITSNNPGIFSAGLDILEMFQPKPDRLRDFWTALQEMWIRLYGSKLIVMAAINGHSPAGGCLMACCCDYRVMAEGKSTIGLNETKLGIVAPTWFMLTMRNVIGQRETEKALQMGYLYSGEEALNTGLIDELVPAEQVMSTTMAQMDKLLRIPDLARQASKLSTRRDTLEHLLTRRKEDVDHFVNFVTQEPVQKFIGMYLESLKAKAAKK